MVMITVKIVQLITTANFSARHNVFTFPSPDLVSTHISLESPAWLLSLPLLLLLALGGGILVFGKPGGGTEKLGGGPGGIPGPPMPGGGGIPGGC